jgi:hypothetical protein
MLKIRAVAMKKLMKLVKNKLRRVRLRGGRRLKIMIRVRVMTKRKRKSKRSHKSRVILLWKFPPKKGSSALMKSSGEVPTKLCIGVLTMIQGGRLPGTLST